jgi:hypothetical protein
VLVFILLCLSSFSCACLHSLVLVFIRLCLSSFSCACLHSLVLVFIRLCLSSFACACLHSLVFVFILLCLSSFACACLHSLVLLSTRDSHRWLLLAAHLCLFSRLERAPLTQLTLLPVVLCGLALTSLTCLSPRSAPRSPVYSRQGPCSRAARQGPCSRAARQQAFLSSSTLPVTRYWPLRSSDFSAPNYAPTLCSLRSGAIDS